MASYEGHCNFGSRRIYNAPPPTYIDSYPTQSPHHASAWEERDRLQEHTCFVLLIISNRMFIVIKTGLKSMWKKEKARSMTCNPSKFLIVLEHLKVLKVILPCNWKKKSINPAFFRGGEHFENCFSCLKFSRQIIFYKIKFNLSKSNIR